MSRNLAPRAEYLATLRADTTHRQAGATAQHAGYQRNSRDALRDFAAGALVLLQLSTLRRLEAPEPLEDALEVRAITHYKAPLECCKRRLVVQTWDDTQGPLRARALLLAAGTRVIPPGAAQGIVRTPSAGPQRVGWS